MANKVIETPEFNDLDGRGKICLMHLPTIRDAGFELSCMVSRLHSRTKFKLSDLEQFSTLSQFILNDLCPRKDGGSISGTCSRVVSSLQL